MVERCALVGVYIRTSPFLCRSGRGLPLRSTWGLDGLVRRMDPCLVVNQFLLGAGGVVLAFSRRIVAFFGRLD